MKPTASKRKTSLTAEEAADLSYFADNEQDPSMPPPAEKKERVDVTPLSNNLAEKIKQMVDSSATSEKTTYAVLSAQGSLIQALENQGLKLKPMVLEPSQKMLSVNDPTVLMKDAPKVLTKLATVKVDAELQGELQQSIKAHYSNPDVHDELMEVFEKKQQQEITARNNTLNTNATIIDIEKRKDKQGNVSRVLTTVDEHGISYQVLEKANMKDLKLKIGNDINIQGVTMEKVDSLTGERKFAIKPTTQQVSLINTTQNTVKVEPPVQPKPGSGKSVMMTNKAEPPVQPEPGLVKSVMMNIKVEPPVQPEPAAPAVEVAKDAPSILYIAKQETKQSFDFNNGNTNIEGRVRMDVNPDYMQLRKGDSPEILIDFHTEAKDLDHDTYLTLKVVAGDENSLTEGVYFSASGSSNFGMSGKVNSQTFEGAMNEIADALEKDATFNWAVGNDAGMLDVIREFGKTAAPTYLSEQEISQFQEQRAEIQKIKALDNITENQAIKKFNEPPVAPAAEVTQGVTAPEVNVVETQEPTPAKATKVEEQQPAPQEQRSTPSYGTTIEEVKEKLESTDFSMNVELSNKLREQNAEAPSAKFMKLMEINDGDYHVMPSIKRFDSEKQKVGMKSITDLEKMPFANDAEKMEAYANQIESRVAFMDKIENGELDFSPKNLTTTQGFVPTYNINKNSDSMRLGAYTSGIKGDNVKIEVPTRDSYAVIYGKVNSLNDAAPSKTDHIIVNTGEKVTDSMLFAEVDKNVDKSNLAIVHIPPENIKNVLGKLMTANPKSKVTMIIDNNAQEVDFTAEDSLGREISSKKAGDVIERVVVEQAINNDKISVVRLNEKFGHSFTNVYEQVLKQVSQNKQIDDPKEFTRKALGNVIESSKQEGEQLVQQVKSIADIQPTVANDKDNTQALEQGKEYKPNRYMKI